MHKGQDQYRGGLWEASQVPPGRLDQEGGAGFTGRRRKEGWEERVPLCSTHGGLRQGAQKARHHASRLGCLCCGSRPQDPRGITCKGMCSEGGSPRLHSERECAQDVRLPVPARRGGSRSGDGVPGPPSLRTAPAPRRGIPDLASASRPRPESHAFSRFPVHSWQVPPEHGLDADKDTGKLLRTSEKGRVNFECNILSDAQVSTWQRPSCYLQKAGKRDRLFLPKEDRGRDAALSALPRLTQLAGG